VPVIIGGELVGQVSLANSPKGYSEGDIEIISRLASIYAMAVIHERDLASLRGMEEQFKLFMDNSPFFAFIKDAEGRYTYVNRRFTEFFGVGEDKIIGRVDMDIWPGKAARRSRDDDLRVLAEGKGIRLIEAVQQEQDVHEYLTIKFPMTGISFHSKLLGGMSIDVTDMRRAESALRAANEKLRILGSLTRHDTLNQLMILQGCLALATESKEFAEMAKLASSMQTAVAALSSQMEFAAEYERIGTVPLEWIDVRDACSEAQSSIGVGDFEVECSVRDFEIYADPMFSKVFQNLFINTIKHGQHSKRIIIEAEEQDEGLRIVCSDDGVGVPPQEKETIFDAGVGKNTGLGLYLVRELLKTCQMTIREVGEHGRGARFEIFVPAKSYRVKAGRH
jgi:PAS domain S-box-containing protein